MTKPDKTQAALKTHDPELVALPYRNATVFEDAWRDNMLTTVVALGMELWTLRRRALVTEAVLKRAGLDVAQIDAYKPSQAESLAWARERDAFLTTVFGALGRGEPGTRLSDLVPPGYEDPALRARRRSHPS